MKCVLSKSGDGVECKNCKRFINSGNTNIIAICRTTCSHKGRPTGTIKVACGQNKNRNEQSNQCEKHKRCLPNYWPNQETLAEWNERPESELYHLCHGCTEFETSES